MSKLLMLWQKALSQVQEVQKEPPLPSGLSVLDDIIWGLHKQEVLVIGGYPKTGKTSLVLNIAYHLADLHHKTCYFTLEMSEISLIKRLFSLVCGVEAEPVRRHQLDPFDIETIKKAEGIIKDIPLEIEFGRGYTPGDIGNYLLKKKPEVLIIDHIQAIRRLEGLSMVESINEYITFLKKASVKFDCAVVVCSQMTRVITGKRNEEYKDIEDSFTKGSRGIDESADTVLHLSWNQEKNEYKIIVKLQRDGESGVANVQFIPHLYLFRNLERK